MCLWCFFVEVHFYTTFCLVHFYVCMTMFLLYDLKTRPLDLRSDSPGCSWEDSRMPLSFTPHCVSFV